MSAQNIIKYIDIFLKKVYTKYIRKELVNMTTTIQKWGNSQGVRIPKILLDTVKWSENEEIEINAEDGKLIIEKAKEHKRKNIKELFKDYKGDYEPIEIDWGETKGGEIW